MCPNFKSNVNYSLQDSAGSALFFNFHEILFILRNAIFGGEEEGVRRKKLKKISFM